MKNKLQENMIRFGTKNLSEQFLKNVADKVKSKIEDITACKGVTLTTPPAGFSKYVNTATDLYFYGVSSYNVENENRITLKGASNNARQNLINSLLSNEQPKPIGKPQNINNNQLATAKSIAIPEFVLATELKCMVNNEQDGTVIHWVVYTIPVSTYNELKTELAAKISGK